MRAVAYAVAALLSITSQSALGALVRVDFAGSVQSITPPSPAPAGGIGYSIQLGTRFSGSFTYDDSVVPNDAQGESCSSCPAYRPVPIWSLYFMSVAAHGELGTLVVDTPGYYANAASDVFDNELYLDGAPPSYVDMAVGGGGALIWLKLNGASPGSPLHGTSLASVPWDLGSFPSTTALWRFAGFDVLGSVDQLSAVPAPEPAVAGLVALAACAMLAAMRSVSRRTSATNSPPSL